MQSVLMDGSAQTIARAATQGHGLEVKPVISSSPSRLTPGQPVLPLTLHRQTSGRGATRAPPMTEPEKAVLDPQSPALQTDVMSPGHRVNYHESTALAIDVVGWLLNVPATC